MYKLIAYNVSEIFKSEHNLYSFIFIHMKMKKLLVGAFLWIFTLAWVAVLPNYTSAASGDWDNPSGDTNYLSDKNDTKLQGSQLLETIKKTIKWILGILATVAVVICLYAGFVMMTSAGDENKYKNGMKILKYAAIWLAIILLSWLIVSVIFRFVHTQGGTTGVME